MGFLPHDPISLAWGFAGGVGVLLLAGFRRRAPSAPAQPMTPALSPSATPAATAPQPEAPKAPQTIEVDPQFKPSRYKPDDCVWVRSESLARFEADGYNYYRHPSNGAKCVRYFEGDVAYLMINPYADEPDSSPPS
jgi:hypothetical protein